MSDDGLTVLLNENQAAFALSPLPPGEALRYPTGFHIGSNVNYELELYEIHARLATAGVPIIRPMAIMENVSPVRTVLQSGTHGHRACAALAVTSR